MLGKARVVEHAFVEEFSAKEDAVDTSPVEGTWDPLGTLALKCGTGSSLLRSACMAFQDGAAEVQVCMPQLVAGVAILRA